MSKFVSLVGYQKYHTLFLMYINYGKKRCIYQLSIMIATVLLAVLFSHIGSDGSLQDGSPEEIINKVITNINDYTSENNYQDLQFKDYRVLNASYDFNANKIKLGNLSTIQLKTDSQSSINTVISNIGTTHYYNVTLELQKGFVEYDYLLKFPYLFSSSGTVTATGKHSFQVEGNVQINSAKQCQGSVSKISTKLGHLQVSITPSGIFHFYITPFVRYLTNVHSQELIPLEANIADYINSIQKSKFSDIVCKAFNK